LPPVSTTPAVLVTKFATGVVDTGGKFYFEAEMCAKNFFGAHSACYPWTCLLYSLAACPASGRVCYTEICAAPERTTYPFMIYE
jgi:hypothetical protein